MKDIIITTLAVAFCITAIVWGLVLSRERDARLAEWADSYEKCVELKYSTTPSAWYAIYKQYPECDIFE